MLASHVSRRTVLSSAAALTAASYSRVLGANERISLGLIGCGERGVGVMRTFVNTDRVEVPMVCDVWAERLDVARKVAVNAKTSGDHRAVLDSKVDAVLIATPDHWHCPIALEALRAGKDVYVEKPLSLTIDEGAEVVKAARVNNRICQVGMQQRSGKHYIQAREEIVKAGKLGKVTLARTWWHGNGYHLRKAPERLQTRPSNLDWGRFLGPVRWREYDPQQYYNFRAYLEYGGGQVTDLFTHWIDVVHMFLEQDNPIAASAAGGVYHYKDGRTAPDTINVLLEYPAEWTATFEATLAPGITGAAVEICGTEGRLWIDRGRFEYWQVRPRGTPRPAGPPEPTLLVKADRDQTIDHVENFLDCMKSRKLPNGDVWIGHRSAVASHLGNIAYLQKRRIRFNPDREEILPL
jgi:predicted dehydrogenase